MTPQQWAELAALADLLGAENRTLQQPITQTNYFYWEDCQGKGVDIGMSYDVKSDRKVRLHAGLTKESNYACTLVSPDDVDIAQRYLQVALRHAYEGRLPYLDPDDPDPDRPDPVEDYWPRGGITDDSRGWI